MPVTRDDPPISSKKSVGHHVRVLSAEPYMDHSESIRKPPLRGQHFALWGLDAADGESVTVIWPPVDRPLAEDQYTEAC